MNNNNVNENSMNNNNINNNNNMNNNNVNENNMNNNNINNININNINIKNNNNINDNNLNNININNNNNDNEPIFNINAFNRPTIQNMNNIRSAMGNFIKSSDQNSDNNKNIDLNKEISFKFSFNNDQSFNIKAKLSDKFEDIVKKFRESECPEELKYSLSLAFNKNAKINFDKNIHENNIKEGDIISFESYMRRSQKNSKYDPKIDANIQQLMKKWTEEYEANQQIEYFAIIQSLPTGEEIPSFDSLFKKEDLVGFLLDKVMTVGITVSEHQHKLVYCLTNYDWKCDICKINYNKKEPTYFCSLCDYNMCDKCRKEKNYEHSSSFPEVIIPPDESIEKFIESPLHDHRLAYCRFNLTYVNLSDWKCSLCEAKYESDIWPFYCTKCNFKLCYICQAGI
jgi:hypothetical protein